MPSRLGLEEVNRREKSLARYEILEVTYFLEKVLR